ncbi:hypothetical protein Ancab_027943 [Ancistrocladus abbreviatus]
MWLPHSPRLVENHGLPFPLLSVSVFSRRDGDFILRVVCGNQEVQIVASEDGEAENRDEEDRESDCEAGDLCEEEERAV